MGDPDLAGALALEEYRPGASAVLADVERWPTASSSDLDRLRHWRTHPDAPAWTHATGDRLTAAQTVRVRMPLPLEGWLDAHLAAARNTLRYRDVPGLDTLADFPTVTRADLAADIAAFVPLDADLDRMVHGTSSGSTGAALQIPDDVEDVARTFHLLRDLASRLGVRIEPDRGRMVLANLVHQREAFTYVSLVSSFAHTVMARVNLHPASWPDAASRRRFLAEADPQILSGHPTSLEAACDLRDVLHPKVAFSSAMELSAPLRARIEDALQCPVIDLYGLHETRPIAWRPDAGPFRVLERRVLVELLDADGCAVPDGEVGEITVTAGENLLLPLVRYRTGDFARRVPEGLADLEGRAHVVFRAADGRRVPSVDLTQQLQAHGALGWLVAQDAAGAVRARIVGGDTTAIDAALRALLGGEVRVEQIGTLAALGEGKPRRYTTERGPLG